MFRFKKFIVNPIQVNCYLLWDETNEAVLIDCGAWFPKEREEIKDFILTYNLSLKHHLNTHMHFDHIFGNAFIEETFGVKAEANKSDWPWAEKISERVARFGFEYNEKVPELGRELNDGDEILFGNHRIAAIAVPGHSPGSLAYYLPQESVIFTGDALFKGSIGRTDFHDSDHKALIKNIHEKLLVLPEETVVYPGHDRETTIGMEKTYNMFL
ncbi:MAG: MBL fold metallo-hydrolase [Bacteroidaceae bacterium]|nr:MBL fold metallo-hydrolase [Bacteroidaceae bacterium]